MIKTFGFQPGDIIADKYEVISYLGGGWEGEVFKIKEQKTNIELAAKIFFPNRNIRNRTATTYAKKLHKLRSCPLLIQYYNFERIKYEGTLVTVFISEFVEGDLLTDYVKKYRGKVMPIYQGLHLLHALTSGVEHIHQLGEYHGDLHAGNVMVRGLGRKFDLKLMDLFHYGKANKENRQDDIVNIIRIFYDCIGGQKRYAKHPAFVKSLCCGLKRTLILKKFKTAAHLRLYLENNDWS